MSVKESFNSTAKINKYERAFKQYANLYNEAKRDEKHKYLYPIRSSGIKFSQAQKFGFSVTKYMWKKSMHRSGLSKGLILNDFHSN